MLQIPDGQTNNLYLSYKYVKFVNCKITLSHSMKTEQSCYSQVKVELNFRDNNPYKFII